MLIYDAIIKGEVRYLNASIDGTSRDLLS